MQHYVAFHLGLGCLPNYPFRGLQYTKGYDSQTLQKIQNEAARLEKDLLGLYR